MRFLPVAAALLLLAVPQARAADAPKKDKDLEDAVSKALTFLQNNQREDGGWSAGQAGGPNAGVSGLCVMAFLSAGHVPGEGPFAATVEKGIRFVLKAQQANGLIATEGHHEMYHHGICTLMLAEVAGMTEGPLAEEVRKKLEKAVAVILKAQRKDGQNRGGWRYTVNGTDTDISVTGWQVMALRAAKNLGCDVPPEAIERAVEYVKRCQDPASGGFRYMPNGRLTVACTGTSILALEICGKDQHRSPEVLKAAGFLLKNPPVWAGDQFSYCMYYCSQATFQLGGQYWNSYRAQMHKVLLGHRSDGGGWFGADAASHVYGPKYTTAMAVLALTVEYRYLPIYQRGEEPTEKEK
ncbi:MAG TPA: prenyltransferase/squalene oxidase repeat-containing protein [Gemmataceae bacterium]|nr:prenyltransferase/squalene oxidase repeat-containing protein [Gemmataceae bacterium]